MMGIAGSGKGTQGKMLADKENLHLISMGEVLRMFVRGERRRKMLAGELLDDDEIIKIVDKVLTSLADPDKALLDGFPRTVPQAQWLLAQAKQGRFSLQLAFHLVASREVVMQRLLERGRIDDVKSSINERFNEYERSTEPLLKWLSQNGVKVINVDAEKSVEEVNRTLLEQLARA